MKKKLMILGAGPFQVPAIRKAQELGHKVLVCSYYKDDPGMTLADKAFHISTLDIKEVLAVCKNQKIDGIMTLASEASAPTVAYVAEELGLPGYPYETACTILNKYALREAMRKNNICCPTFGRAKTVNEAVAIFDSIDGPAIMKPLDASGSRGVCRIESKRDLIKHFKRTQELSFRAKAVLIEDFIQGTEVGGDCLIFNGKITFMQITNKFKNQFYVPVAHSVPSHFPLEIQVKIREELQKAVDSLQLQAGALNFDVFLVNNQDPMILELGGRLGGNCIPEIIHLSTGIDTIENAIQIALDEPPELLKESQHGKNWQFPFDTKTNRPTPLSDATNTNHSSAPTKAKHHTPAFNGSDNFDKNYYCVKLLGADRDGILRGHNDLENIQANYPNIIDITLDYKIGRQIRKFDQGEHRLGHVIFFDESYEESIKFCAKLDGILGLNIEDL